MSAPSAMSYTDPLTDVAGHEQIASVIAAAREQFSWTECPPGRENRRHR